MECEEVRGSNMDFIGWLFSETDASEWNESVKVEVRERLKADQNTQKVWRCYCGRDMSIPPHKHVVNIDSK